MNNRKQNWIVQFLLIAIFLAFTNSCKNPTNGKTTAVFNPHITYGTMTDQDGNEYKTVTIGKQVWMAENLRTTKYCDGSPIKNVTDKDEWKALKTAAYCNYKNTANNDTIATHGRLYNWYTVNTGKLAPAGWHIPSDAEWTELTTYLGGESVAGPKLKEIGAINWYTDYSYATNESGFTALPGGYRKYNGEFSNINNYARWWSSTEESSSDAWLRDMDDSFIDSLIDSDCKFLGLSVRCVKD